MVLAELFEQAIAVAKTVWRKRGSKLTRTEVTRVVAVERPAAKSEDKHHAE
jgi:hypothetical protein